MLSNLTAEQRNSLQAMPQVLGLAAGAADDTGRQCAPRYDGSACTCG